MAETKPKFNDLLKENPDKPFPCLISSKGNMIEGNYGKSWIYTVIHQGKEYVYFANQEYHMLDINRLVEQGKCSMTITLIPELINGKTTHRYLVEANDTVGTTTQKAVTPPTYPTQTIGRNFDEEARGKCRYGFALEVFKALLAEKKTPQVTMPMTKLIDDWVNYSMRGIINVDLTPQKEEFEYEDPSLTQLPL